MELSDDMSLVLMGRTKITMNKPIYAGATVLGLSKILMYNTFCLNLFGEYMRMLMMDTDSFIYEIKKQDPYKALLPYAAKLWMRQTI